MVRRIGCAMAAMLALLAAVGPAQAASGTIRFLGDPTVGPQVRPRLLALSSAPKLDVGGARWRAWGGRTAVGDGIAHLVGCDDPRCTAVVHRTVPVRVELSDPVRCAPANGYPAGRYYSVVRLDARSDGRRLFASVLRGGGWVPCRDHYFGS